MLNGQRGKRTWRDWLFVSEDGLEFGFGSDAFCILGTQKRNGAH